MRFKAATLKVSLINSKSTLGKSIANYISVVDLLVEGFVQGASQKELFITNYISVVDLLVEGFV